MLNFPKEEDFPLELRRFRLKKPLKLGNFPNQFSSICFLIPNDVLDDYKGIFKIYSGKRPDSVHYSKGLGFVEDKTSNYPYNKPLEQFDEFKEFFEEKYKDNKYCSKLKYCIIKAEKLGDKMKRIVTLEKGTKRLKYLTGKKYYNANGEVPIYFVKTKN